MVSTGLVARLRSRTAEIEDAIVACIRSVESDEPGTGDVQYEAGQRGAIVAVLAYACAGIEHGDEWASPIPAEAVIQARRAARTGVKLGTIFRRYYAASTALTDFVTQEAFNGALLADPAVALRGIQRTQASLLDRLIATINDEYVSETARVDRSLEQRQSERVRRLLAGSLVDSTELGYDLDAWHLALIGKGLGVGQALRGMAAGLDSRLLCVASEDQSIWGWLGGKRSAVQADLDRLLRVRWPRGVSLALGAPAAGLAGWRESHSQAQDALLVSLYQPQTLTLYSDVALLVPWLRDEARGHWLVNTYLSPLDNGDRPNIRLRATLRAYFDAGRNASAAGNTLRVTRRTIRNRMNLIRQRLGPLVDDRQAELELALRLAELLRDRS